MALSFKTLPRPSRWQYFGLGFGFFCLLLREVSPASFIEAYYSRGLYIFISKAFQLVSFLPFSFSYISIPVLLFLIFWPIFKTWKSMENLPSKIFKSFIQLTASIGWLAGGFFLLWGFNYGRVPTEQQLGFEDITITLEQLQNYVKADVPRLMEMREQISTIQDPTADQIYSLQNSLKEILSSQNYPAEQQVVCHPLYPKGTLLRWSTSGIYIPYSGQGHIDPGLHALQKPFVLAHEMAHGYGFTGEGICNFWAYVACVNTNDPLLQYAGGLGLWRYMASSWRYNDEPSYLEFRKDLPAALIQDLNEINQAITAYPDILPAFRDYVYDSFLKSQGLQDGIQNYDKIIPMAIQWRERGGD